MPAGLAKIAGNRRINWDYNTVPEPRLGNRVIWWPRGKVLGGSSSINAMCYIRGVAGDYDDWAAQGAEGWDWASVLPCFMRAEGNTRGGSELHGGDGPRSEEHTSELQSLMRTPYAIFFFKHKIQTCRRPTALNLRPSRPDK